MSEAERIRWERRQVRRLVSRALLHRAAAIANEARAPLAPLKGAWLDLIAPEAEPRPMLDVDVLVGPQHRARLERALRRDGFLVRARSDGSVTLRHPSIDMDLDLHERLFGRGLFRLDTAGVLCRARVARHLDRIEVLQIDALDAFAHFVGHFVRGRLPERDRRHVSDFGRVAALCALDAGRAAEHLDRHGLGRAARRALPLAARAGDTFSGEVLRRLRADPLGDWIAPWAGATLDQSGFGVAAVLAAHALNYSIPAGMASLAWHAARAARARFVAVNVSAP